MPTESTAGLAGADPAPRPTLATVVAVPVTADGTVAPGWGRAGLVAVAEVHAGQLVSWQVHPVGWDDLHDEGTEGAHHARIARFLIDERVDVVVVDHIGAGMVRMLTTMGISVASGMTGDARTTVLRALRSPSPASDGTRS